LVLLTCEAIAKRFGAQPLFENLSLTISDSERIGLIGPNGAGKSTLLRILAGLEQPDSGSVSVRKLARMAYVPQESAFAAERTVLDVVLEALEEEHIDEHEKHTQAAVILGRAGFTDHTVAAGTLSGGWRKRLAIARELVRNPDLLLLDEPTNHLDLEGILWLERLLAAAPFAAVVVSHDRYFLENAVTDMAEISRIYPGGIFRVKGRYSELLLKREEFLEAQARQEEALANRVRREVEWLRRGPKARTGKSKARIESAGRLIEELEAVSARHIRDSVQIDFTASERRTKRLVTGEALARSLGGRTLFADLSFTLSPGMRIGLVGPNGSGKTTLLRIIAGELAPDAGTITRADNLRIVYFEQSRDELDPDVSLRRALAPDADSVLYRGRPIHVAGWAKRFLFRNDQLDMPVRRLSGGERARVLIARLMLQEADVLLLDEPTNDLDIPTLEVLEDSLLEFPGALVLVTHDRYLLDRVATVVLGIDPERGPGVFADYSQWEDSRSEQRPQREKKEKAAEAPAAPRRKLSYIEGREYEQIEARIADAESALTEVHRQLEDPAVVSDPRRLSGTYAELQDRQAEVDRLYERWAELESKLQPTPSGPDGKETP
jgi:ATP-binding cassette subfamily F protein uup